MPMATMASKPSKANTEVVSNKDIQKLIMEMDVKFTEMFSNVCKEIQEVKTEMSIVKTEMSSVKHEITLINTAVSGLKSDYDGLSKDVEFTAQRVEELEGDRIPNLELKLEAKIQELEEKHLLGELHDRKNNLLFYGITEVVNEDPYRSLEVFLKDDLKIEDHKAASIINRAVNAHRLPSARFGTPQSGAPPKPFIMRMGNDRDKQVVLKSASNLRGTRKSVRTDLPPSLKRERGRLSGIAYKLRTDKGLKTRIRVSGIRVILEHRESISASWKEYIEQ